MHGEEEPNYIHVRRRAFVLNDLSKLGQAEFYASKYQSASGVDQICDTSVAFREYTKAKFSKALRFMNSDLHLITTELDNSVAVMKVSIESNQTLFVGK